MKEYSINIDTPIGMYSALGRVDEKGKKAWIESFVKAVDNNRYMTLETSDGQALFLPEILRESVIRFKEI